MNSRASFDTLAITARLSAIVGPVSQGEVHLFGYLSCLIYLYKGNPSSGWGYPFLAAMSGAPFSADLDQAIALAIQIGFLEDRNRFLSITALGSAELSAISSLTEFNKRVAYIEPACSSALAMPLGLVRAAVHQVPSIASSSKLQTNRNLLDQLSLLQVQEQFSAVRSALGDVQEDLLSPAITWIMYYSQRDLLNSSADYDN